MSSGGFRRTSEWFLSHLAWEGFKWILSASALGIFLALVRVVSSWVKGHPNVTQIVATLVGLLVVVTLFICREKARRVRPRLKLTDPRSQGMYDIEPNAIGFTVSVMNDEYRLQTIAHHVRASLIFRHPSLSDKVKISPALWVLDGAIGGGRRLTDSVSIGMGESRSLFILFWHNSKQPISFLTTANTPLSYHDASHLALGEWKLDIVLEGDNVKYISKNRLVLQPTGVSFS
jgi:HAMP domain-containing protein